jgi:hypothetical protein
VELSYRGGFDEVLAHLQRCHICFYIEDIYFIIVIKYNSKYY